MGKDLIDRTKLIKFLETVTVTEGITFETGFKQILVDIKNQPREMQWILCKEKMPEEGQSCLVTYLYNGHIDVSQAFMFFGGNLAVVGDSIPCDPYSVIAWMPLPEPYEVGGVK